MKINIQTIRKKYYLALTNVIKLNFETINLFFFFYLSIMLYFFIEIGCNVVFTNVLNHTILLFFNLGFMIYFYEYFKFKNFNSKDFFLFFILLKYLNLIFGISWTLTQVSSLFETNSVIVGIGTLLNYDLSFVSFVVSFLASIIDFLFLILFFKLSKFLLKKESLVFRFENNFLQLLKTNFLIFQKFFVQNKIGKKIEICFILSVMVLTPIAYSESMQTIHNTNDGIYYLTDALNLLLSYFQKHTGLTGIFSNSTELLKVKNILYFSAKNLKLSELELKSLNSPL